MSPTAEAEMRRNLWRRGTNTCHLQRCALSVWIICARLDPKMWENILAHTWSSQQQTLPPFLHHVSQGPSDSVLVILSQDITHWLTTKTSAEESHPCTISPFIFYRILLRSKACVCLDTCMLIHSILCDCFQNHWTVSCCAVCCQSSQTAKRRKYLMSLNRSWKVWQLGFVRVAIWWLRLCHPYMTLYLHIDHHALLWKTQLPVKRVMFQLL